MPIVQIEIMKRSVEQKRAMVAEVTDAICRTAGCSKEAVSIIIRDMARENYANAGKLDLDR